MPNTCYKIEHVLNGRWGEIRTPVPEGSGLQPDAIGHSATHRFAEGEGLEPSTKAPKAPVLPLHHPSMFIAWHAAE